MNENTNALQVFLANEFGDNIQSYTGRAMYGESCLAVVGCPNIILATIAKGILSGELREDGVKAIECHRVDSMGRGHVVYFPGFPFEQDSDAAEE